MSSDSKSLYQLRYQERGQPKVFEFGVREVLIGRAPDNDLTIGGDFGVSRNHAKLVATDEECVLVDLGSTNGTSVNGVPITRTPLSDGDDITLGKFGLKFGLSKKEQVVFAEERELSPDSGTIIRSVQDLRKYVEAAAPPPAPASLVPAASDSRLREIEESNKILRVLSRVAETLIKVQPLQDILELVMNMVFEYIPAERGFLMLYREDTKQLEPVVVKYSDQNEVQPEIRISRTIADKVFTDKVAIITSDAQIDPRFTGGESIRFLGIRSAMCAPLYSEDKVIGIIHVDSAMKTVSFQERDLGLLTALANYCAVGIERARLNETIDSERSLRSRLERYHSPNVVKRILQGDGGPGGDDEAKEMEITVLFSDVVGFTSLSESLPPSEVAKLLNTYFTIMGDIIFKFEGTLDKFIGDALMAVFGAPFAQADHADRAIQAALEMAEELREFNAGRKDAVKLDIRTGINSGRCVVGNIGSASRVDFTVLGDPVNVASRIEQYVARPGTCVIGESTEKLVKDRFQLRDLGTQQLKGLKKQIHVYEVLGLATATDRAPITT